MLLQAQICYAAPVTDLLCCMHGHRYVTLSLKRACYTATSTDMLHHHKQKTCYAETGSDMLCINSYDTHVNIH